MANPEIESELDGIDRVSVCLYRLGLSLAALLLLCRGASLLLGQDFLAPASWLVALTVASGVCGLCLHVYDKRIRFVLQGLGWGALLLSASGAPDVLVLGRRWPPWRGWPSRSSSASPFRGSGRSLCCCPCCGCWSWPASAGPPPWWRWCAGCCSVCSPWPSGACRCTSISATRGATRFRWAGSPSSGR